ncbi:MAG: hypothetical protein QW733_03785 [Desulfurococcaceae archaeon]
MNKVPSISTLHRMFYSELRKHGFRAHHVKQIYVYAKAVVKACKRNIINVSEMQEQVKGQQW